MNQPEAHAPMGLQSAICGICAIALGNPDILPSDDLFELGGHSLPVMKIVAQVRRQMHVAISVKDVFDARTPERLAYLIEARRSTSKTDPGLSGAEKENVVSPVGRSPASYPQQQLWLINEIEGDSSHYNMSISLRFPSVPNVRLLRRAAECVAERQEALRTSLQENRGLLVQVVRPECDVDWTQTDLSERKKSVPWDLKSELDAFAEVPFDLADDRPIRFRFYRLSEYDCVLQIVMHHIAFDGWSYDLLMHEISESYNALVEGRIPRFKPLPAQYGAYAVRQRYLLEGPQGDNLRRYWRGALEGLPECISIPTDRARPPIQSYRGDRASQLVSLTVLERLRSISARAGATLYMGVLATFIVLLHRLGGDDDIAVGSPVACREPDFEHLIGFFANTVVMRCRIDPDETFNTLLSTVKKTVLDGLDNQFFPFQSVVEALNPPRSMSQSPIFQVLFTFQGYSVDQWDFGGCGATISRHDITRSKYDLSLEVTESSHGLKCTFEYATDLFERDTIERYLEHLVTLMEAIVSSPESPVSRLQLLTPTQRTKLIVEFNQSSHTYPRDCCIHELFEAQVALTGESPAIICEGGEITYGDLNTRANRLAAYLRKRGVGPDVLVVICMSRSIEMAVALLAVLKAGGAYVPLDPTYPAERLGFMIADCSPKLLLSLDAADIVVARALEGLERQLEVIGLVDEAWLWADEPGTNLCVEESQLDGGHLAYVIYTSGSTGVPKGVMVEHRNVVSYLRAISAVLPLDKRDTIAMHTTISFDIAVTELFLPLTRGAKVLLCPDSAFGKLEELALLIESGAISALQATPSVWRSLLEIVDDFPQITALTGGEYLGSELADTLIMKIGSVWNVYGPTEATVWATAHRLGEKTEDVSLQRYHSRIGRPIENTRIYLLDKHEQPVPIGAIGEISIGGAGVARGYLNRDALTTERFIPSPFRVDDRLYKTGDLGRYLSDGTIEFLGRTDHQVKIRGHRVELGEIESSVAAYVGIREAVVRAVESGQDERRLVAYFTTVCPDQQIDVRLLRDYLSLTLPRYMVPTAYVQLSVMPQTANGKLDRKALPIPDGSSYGLRTYDAPRGQVEEAIARIWGDILGHEQVGRDDNFFDLGGHSLLLARVATLIYDELNIRIPLRAMFAAPRLSALLALVPGLKDEAGEI